MRLEIPFLLPANLRGKCRLKKKKKKLLLEQRCHAYNSDLRFQVVLTCDWLMRCAVGMKLNGTGLSAPDGNRLQIPIPGIPSAVITDHAPIPAHTSCYVLAKVRAAVG